MKQLFKVVLAASAALVLSWSANAHNRNPEKFRAERVAFLTEQLQLTSDEAEKFWPVYNKMSEDKKQALGKVIESYKALETATAEGASEDRIKELTGAYLAANKAFLDVDIDYYDQFLNVLPAEKVAKLYLAEEKFRRCQIYRLGGNKGDGKSDGKPGRKPGDRGPKNDEM